MDTLQSLSREDEAALLPRRDRDGHRKKRQEGNCVSSPQGSTAPQAEGRDREGAERHAVEADDLEGILRPEIGERARLDDSPLP